MDKAKQDEDARIRERAYHMWDQDGRPDGRAEDHWALAREAIALEDAGGGATKPVDESKEPIVEEAFIQDNLGEFPTAFTDQGDRRQTPADHQPVAAKKPAARKAAAKPAAPKKAPAQKPVAQQKRG